MYTTLKLIHVTAATVSVSGFALRGLWMLRSSALLERRLVRILPHVVDSLFLLSGIGLVLVLRLPVFSQPWLLVKLAAVVAYILLGMVALRRGRTLAIRAVSYVLALAMFAYIVGVAMSKSILSWLALSFA